MNQKLPIILVAIIIAIFLAIAYLAFFQKRAVAPTNLTDMESPTPSPESFEIEDEILKNALNLYSSKKQAGIDFTNGPCLGNANNDWVVDIAHNPRQEIDDEPNNQCVDFLKNRAKHFIELDPDGNLIRAQ